MDNLEGVESDKIKFIKRIILEIFGKKSFEKAEADFSFASSKSHYSMFMRNAIVGKDGEITDEEVWTGILKRKCGNFYQSEMLDQIEKSLGKFKYLDENGVTEVSDPKNFCRRNNITNLQEFIAKHMDAIQPELLSQDEIEQMLKQLTVRYKNEYNDPNWIMLLVLIRKWIEDYLFDVSYKRLERVLLEKYDFSFPE